MKKQKIIIGRATTCDIVLGDMTVSRIHAELELLENKKLLLTDCHSSQGTFLIRNGIGEKVKQQIVSEHDQLQFGSIKISVRELLKETGLHGQNKVTVKPKEKVQNHQVAGQVNQDKIKKECLTDNKEEKESFSTLFFSLDGRIPRSTFWLKYMLPYLVIYIVLAVIDIATGSFDYSIGYGTYSAIFTLLAIIPTLLWKINTNVLIAYEIHQVIRV